MFVLTTEQHLLVVPVLEFNFSVFMLLRRLPTAGLIANG